MTNREPVGIDNFKELIESKDLFIDKTLFIKEALEDSAKVTLITRPRRFGKSLNLSMLYYFLSLKEDSKHLFEHLKIAKESELVDNHLNKYPTIFITFKDIKYNKFEDFELNTKKMFENLFMKFDYLLNSEFLNEKEKNYINLIINEPSQLSDLYN